MVSETSNDFRRRAAECQRLADEFTDERARETLLHVASRWLAIAEADEQELRPTKGIEEGIPIQPE